MKDQLRLGIIGLGLRGIMLMRDVILRMDTYRVVALADIQQERVDKALAMAQEKYGSGN